MFVPRRTLQPSLMFVGMAWSLPKSVSAESCFTGVGSGLTCKHLSKLEKLARDKHFGLLRKFRKKLSFITLGPEDNY